MNAQLQRQTGSQSQQAPSFTPTRNGLLQRKCACGGTPGSTGECEECRKKRLQRKVAQPSTLNHHHSEVPPIVHEVLRSPGQPLDAATRAFFEPRFGHDFSQVRVYTDAKAAESVRAVDALAYTVGKHIAFSPRKYRPKSPEGRRLLAHELTHVVQQHSSTVTAPLRIDSAGEREAATVTDSILSLPPSGAGVKVSRITVPALARQADDEGGGTFDDQSLSSQQGQADGKTIREACNLAKENCKLKLDCPPERLDVDKTCSCWKGGEYGEAGYTCITQCRCKEAPPRIS